MYKNFNVNGHPISVNWDRSGCEWICNLCIVMGGSIWNQ